MLETIKKFSMYTNPKAISGIFENYLPGIVDTHWKISECLILDSKLKTYLKHKSVGNVNLSICYQLVLSNGRTKTCIHHIVYAKIFCGGQSQEEYERLSNRHWVEPPIGQAVVHIPDHDLIAWSFPNDPGLPQLPILMDSRQVVSYFPKKMSINRGAPSRIPSNNLITQVINYRPEVRCVIKYVWEGADGKHTQTLFGKTFPDGEGKDLYQRLTYFWERGLKRPGSLMIAEPLGYTETVNTTWQRGVQGAPLLSELNSANYQERMESVVQGLASLHNSEVPGLVMSPLVDQLGEVQKKVNKLSQAAPGASRKLEALLERLKDTIPIGENIPYCPIYWDFHINQLVACDDRIVFFDLDELVIGDPIQDVANFMVDLHFRRLDPSLKRQIHSKFFLAYQQYVDWDVPLSRLSWHGSIQFLNKAYRHYVQQHPDWATTLESVLGMIEQGILPFPAMDEAKVGWRCQS